MEHAQDRPPRLPQSLQDRHRIEHALLAREQGKTS
jgi:hypothetical protein